MIELIAAFRVLTAGSGGDHGRYWLLSEYLHSIPLRLFPLVALRLFSTAVVGTSFPISTVDDEPSLHLPSSSCRLDNDLGC